MSSGGTNDLSVLLAALKEKQESPPEPFTSAIPPIEKLFSSLSLYVDVPIEERDVDALERLRRHNYRFDCYCTACELPSIFAGGVDPHGQDVQTFTRGSNWALSPGYFSCDAYCLRCHGHYAFNFLLTATTITKTGQFPSLEDIQAGDLRRFRSVLPREDLAELKRAGGLFSHGIGIGSFVYLRRIFERLIMTHKQDLSSQGQSIPNWERLRIDEKIDALKSVLPPALVKHKAAYGILSRGLHELDEETCRRYFPVVRTAIVQILEQDLQQREAKRAEVDLEKELAIISAEISGPKRGNEPQA
jgi:hypothetical protein